MRLSGGKFTVTDGPFTEAKEVVAGFALIQADSKEEAIEIAQQFLKVAGDGETEIRQVFEGPDCGTEKHVAYFHEFEQAWREEMREKTPSL